MEAGPDRRRNPVGVPLSGVCGAMTRPTSLGGSVARPALGTSAPAWCASRGATSSVGPVFRKVAPNHEVALELDSSAGSNISTPRQTVPMTELEARRDATPRRRGKRRRRRRLPQELELNSLAAHGVRFSDERRRLNGRLHSPPPEPGPHDHLRHRHLPTSGRDGRSASPSVGLVGCHILLLLAVIGLSFSRSVRSPSSHRSSRGCCSCSASKQQPAGTSSVTSLAVLCPRCGRHCHRGVRAVRRHLGVALRDDLYVWTLAYDPADRQRSRVGTRLTTRTRPCSTIGVNLVPIEGMISYGSNRIVPTDRGALAGEQDT